MGRGASEASPHVTKSRLVIKMKKRQAIKLANGGLAVCWLVAGFSAFSQSTVLLNQSSDPPGLISSSATPVTSATQVITVAAPVEASGYRFTHWTANGVRYQDSTGRGMNPATFTIYENTDCVAHYLSATSDTDADGIPDWFEVHFYNSLANAGSSDADGDGFTLQDEYWRDTHPNLVDTSQDGGVSQRRSQAFWFIANANHVIVRQTSVPEGIVDTTEALAIGTVKTLPDVNSAAAGYKFGGWFVNGIRLADATGRSYGGLSFTVTMQTEAVAYFYPESEDSDADGIPDWLEWQFYGTLTNAAGSDTDGDGFTLQDEFWRDTHPNLADTIQDGGISRRRSEAFPIDLTGFASFRAESVPAGIVSQTTYAPTGTVVQTPTAPESTSGYTFGQWLVNGQRQADLLGFAINPVTFALMSNTVATAYYYPSTEDSDGDGLLDWFEWRYYGSLGSGANSDSDGDGFTLQDEWWRGTHPNIVDTIQDGGVSRRRSEALFINLQPFERLEYVLMDGVLVNFFSANPPVPGSVAFGTNVAPALGDWDGDGDLDLFVASATGSVRVFQNIGSRYTMDLSERTANFAGLAPAWSGIASPALALGDWSGDGRADLVVGGDGGTLRVISSTGNFNTPQSPAVNYVITPGSTVVIPALVDVTGDGKLDLLVLLGNGTVRVYPHTGSSTTPYNAGTFTENLLGEAVPEATGISAADINYDGRPDVLVSDTAGRIWEFYRNAPGTFTIMSKVWGGTGAGFANRLTIAAADVDGDGDMDLIGGFGEGGLVSLRDPRFALPANLRANGGVRSIQLTWDPDRQSRIVGYYVYRSTANTNNFGRLTNTLVTVPRFEDQQPVVNVTNFYQVTAVSAVNYPGNSVPIYLEGRPSDIAGARVGGVTLWMPDYFGKPGSNTVLQINTPNATGISGTNLEIRVTYDPTILTPLSQIYPYKATVEKTGLTKRMSITNNAATANGELIILGLTGRVLTGHGNLFDINFRVNPGAALGTQTTNTFSQVTLRDASGNIMAVDTTDIAVMKVANSYFPGDVNGDGIVSQADFVLAMKLAVGQRPATPNEIAAGDMNGNGEIDKDDAHFVLRMVKGKEPNPSEDEDGDN